MVSLERNCKKYIEEFVKDQLESDKRIFGKLTSQIEGLQTEVQHEYKARGNTEQYLQAILIDELPQLREEIASEIGLRKELEQKIEEQFLEQINDLKITFEEERHERESKEEELLAVLKAVSQRVQDALNRTKKERLALLIQRGKRRNDYEIG